MTQELSPAAAEAVHKVKNAQQAIETAREVSLQETAIQTKKVIVDALTEIFSAPNQDNPEHMNIIFQKIPILCTRVDAIDTNIAAIKADMQWVVRAVLSAVFTLIGALVLLGLKLVLHL